MLKQKRNSQAPHRLDNNTMHAKPDLRVFFIVEITGSGSVIVAVIRPEKCFLGIAELDFFLFSGKLK